MTGRKTDRLLDKPAPSGFEAPAAQVWREEAEEIADRVDADVSGNSVALINEQGAPRVMWPVTATRSV